MRQSTSIKKMHLNHCLLILIFILESTLNQTISSQELVFQRSNLKARMIEEFHVLKNNQEIKEGQYKLLIDDYICQIGSFKNNQRSGIWNVLYSQDGVDIEYNYDTNELIFFNKDYYFSKEDSTIRRPIYLGGMRYFIQSIIDILHFIPMHGGIGILSISFDVDPTGIPNNFHLKSSCNNKTLDLKSINAVKKVATSDFKFLPAMRNGRSVSYNIVVQIQYTQMGNIYIPPYE